jgi:general stress protein 26
MPASVFRLLFITTLVWVSSSTAQTTSYRLSELSRDSLLTAARIIIDSSTCKVLITIDEDGKPRAREMAPFPPEENFVIWFGTSSISRKVKQIEKNPNVNVFYYDPSGKSYVTLSGTARIVNDPELKEKYWISGWKTFYPDKEKNYILIEFTPAELEVCSFRYKLFWDKETAVPHILKLAENTKE